MELKNVIIRELDRHTAEVVLIVVDELAELSEVCWRRFEHLSRSHQARRRVNREAARARRLLLESAPLERRKPKWL